MEYVVIFDMDGVLFDTERLCMECWCKCAAEHHIPDMDVVFPKCIGTNVHDTMEIVRNYYGPEFDYEGFRAIADGYFKQEIAQNGMPVKKGVRELLSFLKSRGVKIGLASSTKYASVEAHLKRADIRDYFNVLVTGDMVLHSKPEPEIYLLACDKMGVDPKNAFAIEDSYNGIRSAYRAGMKPLMVPDLIAPDEEMQKLSLEIFEDLLKVKDYFEEQLRV